MSDTKEESQDEGMTNPFDLLDQLGKEIGNDQRTSRANNLYKLTASALQVIAPIHLINGADLDGRPSSISASYEPDLEKIAEESVELALLVEKRLQQELDDQRPTDESK